MAVRPYGFLSKEEKENMPKNSPPTVFREKSAVACTAA